GVLSGNGVQLPVDLPVNVTGNSVNVVGLGNPATGNQSVNGPGDQPQLPRTPAPKPRAPKPPAPVRSHAAPPAARPAAHEATAALAHTG
ncbi:DUF320 domain-containing protein, partial [Streptomyces sp. SID2955]|nr:DUF320 domain-containing protein [Streptomyces sp. SID2955]